MLNILQHVPLWVWPLLVGLLVLGMLQLRDRQVSRWQLMLLPLALLVMGLSTLAPVFLRQPLTALAWAGALGLSSLLGRRLAPPAGVRWLADKARLHLPGSVTPLLLIVSIFTLRFVWGAAQGMHPEWHDQVAVQAPMAAVFGSLTGWLLGRRLALLARCGRGANGRSPTIDPHPPLAQP